MPDWSQELRALVAPLNLEPAREAEIVEELGQHLNDRYEELVAGNATSEQAYRAVSEELREGKLAAALRPVLASARESEPLGRDDREHLLAGLWKDLRYGARLLRINPGFAIVAILSLALGIGANTAIFQLLNAVRLRTLPVRDPQQLGNVTIVDAPKGRIGWFAGAHPDLTNAIWEQVRDQQQGFSNIAVWNMQGLNLNPGGEARYARALWVSGSFFDTLAVPPILGRLIAPSDDHRGCGTGGVVISDSFWQREFGGELSVLGRKITLEGHPFEIIGVTPARFFGIEVGQSYDVALPICAEPVIGGERSRLTMPSAWWLSAVGRLKPGWTFERASAQLAAISPGIFAATVPPTYDSEDRQRFLEFKLGSKTVATGTSTLRKNYENPLWLLMGISALVLLIACSNLASLMLARANARQREFAVRLALGASRVRLIRQLLAESLLLAIIGALCGAALAQAASRALVASLSTQSTQVFVNLAPDWRVLAFTMGLSLLTCLIFGLAPAIQASGTAPAAVMKAGGRGLTAGRERFGTRRVLVISQVAFSLVLLVGALLFVRTFQNLMNLEAGFQRDHILIADIDMSQLKLPMQRRITYKQELLARVRALPGTISAAGVNIVPVSGNGWNENISIPGTTQQRVLANFDQVSSGYFRTMGTPLLAGRDFTDSDTAAATPVAIVTETFARKFLNGASPLGHTFALQIGGKPDRLYQIVGLVKDIKYTDLREEFSPLVFVAETQDDEPTLEAAIVIRSDEPLQNVVSAVKREIAAMSPALVIDFNVFDTMIRQGLVRERLMATLSGVFGFLAAVLAMIGLYGVISYMVVRRRNEIGIRMALGADRQRILGMVMREASTLLGIGLAIGIVLALVSGTAARALLYGLRPSDPWTLVIAASSLAVVAAAASFLPAQRASRLDPMQALREE